MQLPSEVLSNHILLALLFLSGEACRPECRFFQCSAREALHGLVDEMDKENVRELLHDVLAEVYSKSRTDRKPDV